MPSRSSTLTPAVALQLLHFHFSFSSYHFLSSLHTLHFSFVAPIFDDVIFVCIYSCCSVWMPFRNACFQPSANWAGVAKTSEQGFFRRITMDFLFDGSRPNTPLAAVVARAHSIHPTGTFECICPEIYLCLHTSAQTDCMNGLLPFFGASSYSVPVVVAAVKTQGTASIVRKCVLTWIKRMTTTLCERWNEDATTVRIASCRWWWWWCRRWRCLCTQTTRVLLEYALQCVVNGSACDEDKLHD